MMRSPQTLAVLACACSLRSAAQAPATGPLALLLPASTRAMAQGNAGVTGRDDDVLFYNPAQLISVRGGFNTTIARYGSRTTVGSMTSSFTGGPLTLGWGVQVANYSVSPAVSYPFTPAVLTGSGSTNALSTMAAVGAAMTFKGFRIGAAGKYAEDRLSVGNGSTLPALHGEFVGDAGVSHNLWTGVAGLSVQNIGRNQRTGTQRIDVPLQASLGWSGVKQVGELDLGFGGQVTARKGWVSPAAGVDVAYGWIEGYSVAVRAGVRRPETSAEKPITLGGSFNGDRLSLDYALQFFDDAKLAHRLTFRWR